MKTMRAFAVVVVLASLSGSSGCRACGNGDAAAFDADHVALMAKNPNGVSFVVRTRDDRARFVRGEKIPLVLKFASTEPNAHKVDIGTWDNSGRLESDTIHFDPSTTVDPLEHYFDGGRTGGGMRPSPPVLGTNPTEVTIVLNEWARFEKTGHYRLFVGSSRLRPIANDYGMGAPSIIVSDVIAFDIVDDPQWTDNELARARSVLATKPAADQSNDDALNEARTSLRFLNTPGAARAMVDDVCAALDRSRFQTELGLFASPFRRDVVAMLEAGLVAPDCAITPSYLYTLARVAERDGGEADFERTLLANLDKKKGSAIATSVQTALLIVDEREERLRAPDPMREELRARIAPVFATLPEDALARTLETDWGKVRSPQMAPKLLELVKEARPRGGRLRSISDLALERLVELDYDAARAFILSELGRADGARVSFTSKTLGLLKDAELPALDASMLAGIAAEQHDGATLELRAEVVARYASKAVVDRVWKLYRESRYFRISLLAYLWRNDSKAAEAETRTIDVDSLDRLSALVWNPTIEELLIKRLRTSDAGTAVRILALRGSAAAENPIIDRWRELHESHTDKDRLAQTLREELVRARGWMITPEKARALTALCDDAMCNGDLGAVAGRWGADGKQPQLVLWSHTDGTLSGWFGHYDVPTIEDVERRIKQLPAGYAIAFTSKPPDIDAALGDKIRAWAAEKSIPIVTNP